MYDFNKPIILSDYGSAILLLELESPYKCPSEFKTKILSKEIEGIPCKTIKKERLMSKDDFRRAFYEYKNKNIDYIYNNLKKLYPNTDFAEKFISSEDNKKWISPITEHNEQSLNCIYLENDKHHCNKKRNTSCYTCCFVCAINSYCENACIYKKIKNY